MSHLDTLEQQLGEPDLRLENFRLWVHGRQFPDSTDYHDLNWLIVSAACEAPGAFVWFTYDPALLTEELERWHREMSLLLQGKRRRAALDPIEPILNIVVNKRRSQRLYEVEVILSPDWAHPERQRHHFFFAVEEGALFAAGQQLQRILQQYPVLGSVHS